MLLASLLRIALAMQPSILSLVFEKGGAQGGSPNTIVIRRVRPVQMRQHAMYACNAAQPLELQGEYGAHHVLC